MKLDFVSTVAMFGAVFTAPPDSAGAGVAPAGGAASPAAGAGDGADDGNLENADGPGVDDGAAADDPNAGDDDDLERLLVDDEDDDQNGQTRTAEDRIKALNAKNRKLRRRLARHSGTLERLRGVDLDDLVTRARNYSRLEEASRSNPRLRALIHGGDDADADDRTGSRRPTARRQDDDPPFDESKLPFDPNANAANRYFADLARSNHELQRTVRQLAGRLEGVQQQTSAQSEAAVRREWGTVLKDAARQIRDEGIRDVFSDAVRGAFDNPQIRQRYTPQQIVAHYLKRLKVQPAQAARANAAAAQRVAEKNKNLPRHPATGGTPTNARNPRERLADVTKRLRQSVGA